jgi:hypothetical protein
LLFVKNILVAIIVMTSLLIAPLAHAAGYDCASGTCHSLEQGDHKSKEANKDDSKLTKTGHHCCCPHVSAIPSLGVTAPMTVSSRTIFVLEQDATTSVVVGPPLKPPSRA